MNGEALAQVGEIVAERLPAARLEKLKTAVAEATMNAWSMATSTIRGQTSQDCRRRPRYGRARAHHRSGGRQTD